MNKGLKRRYLNYIDREMFLIASGLKLVLIMSKIKTEMEGLEHCHMDNDWWRNWFVACFR